MLNKLFLDLNNFKANLGSVERGDSIELNIKLLNDEDYSRSKFRVLGTKADGKYVEQIEGINLEEKNLKVILGDQFVNCEGIVKLELNVVSVETEITTKEFYFFVSNTMNASIIDSADSLPTLEKVSKYVDDAVNNLDALKEASEDITIINSEFKENEIKRKANEMLREKNEKARLQSEDIRITEEEEREANELERIQSENNRKFSENNRKSSENTRVTNERAREEAELNRQSTFEKNEEIRNSNENLRIASEQERIKFNNNAKTDELNRKEAEKIRVLAEEERKSSEESRVAAESIRQNTYTDFNESEEERKNNEVKREEAEALRIEAETRRDNLFAEKEEERNITFVESETVREEAFKISEKNRKEAEIERIKNENLRVDAEEARIMSESSRVEEEDARIMSESARVEEEDARVIAEEKRVAAEIKREEKIEQFGSQVTKITNQFQFDYWNLATNTETIEQWYIDGSTGAGRKLASFFTVVLDVKENTNYKYEHTSNKTSNLGTNMRARSVAFYDSEDRYISGSSYPELTISTPENCTKMRMCFVYINQNTEEKGNYYITLRETDKKDYIYIDDLKVKSESLEDTEKLKLKSENIVDLDLKLNNHKFSTNNIEIRKPSFSFVFDDGNVTDTNLKELFNEYGFKCGFALLGNENLNNIKDRYLSMQNEGFEILSHSVDGKAMQDGIETVEVIDNKFKTSKKILEDNGFIIKGWVTPSTWLNNKYFNSLKKYYSYGFGHLDTNNTNVIHTVKSKDIRQLDRWSLQSNTVEKTKAKIDECISQNAFMCFYAHKFPSEDNFTEANLREVLQYLKTKVDLGEINIDTPFVCINNYYKIRQYDLL